MNRRTELAYRIAAVDMASPIGLLLALYDTLAGDLRRAASAIHAHDIEQRCAELNHAYIVLGQLESWLAFDDSDPLILSLSNFYSFLRAKMLEASAKQSAPILEAAVDLVVQVRETWQEREAGSQSQRIASAPTESMTLPQPERTPLSQSA